MHLLPSGPLKDITGFWVRCTCNSAWKKSLEETVGSICKGRLKLPQSTRHSRTSLPTVQCLKKKKKNSCFAYFVQFFSCLVHTGKSGSYYYILAESKNSACQYLPNHSCPFKTVGISCSPICIWQLHFSFFCSLLSLP